jgi:predicted Co/Zn/Cd cation transporter (cation efflux family)
MEILRQATPPPCGSQSAGSSLIGAGLSLLAAKLVVQPENRRFPFCYSHLEPLVLRVNSFMLLLTCIHALIIGIERIRAGGNAVDTEGVIWFGLLGGAVSLAIWIYERGGASHLTTGKAGGLNL